MKFNLMLLYPDANVSVQIIHYLRLQDVRLEKNCSYRYGRLKFKMTNIFFIIILKKCESMLHVVKLFRGFH